MWHCNRPWVRVAWPARWCHSEMLALSFSTCKITSGREKQRAQYTSVQLRNQTLVRRERTLAHAHLRVCEHHILLRSWHKIDFVFAVASPHRQRLHQVFMVLKASFWNDEKQASECVHQSPALKHVCNSASCLCACAICTRSSHQSAARGWSHTGSSRCCCHSASSQTACPKHLGPSVSRPPSASWSCRHSSAPSLSARRDGTLSYFNCAAAGWRKTHKNLLTFTFLTLASFSFSRASLILSAFVWGLLWKHNMRR